MNLKYSTPELYLQELKTLNKTYTEKCDDFFPITDDKKSYWSGYFSSRPSTKLFVKETGRFLQIAKSW